MTRVLEIGDLEVEVVKKNIKNLHLAVYPPDGRVRLAAPDNVNDDTLRLFTISRLSWIRKQQRKFAQQDRQSERQYISRESHFFLGKRYLLRIVEGNQPSHVEIKSKTHLTVYVKPGYTASTLLNLIDKWYRAELKRVVLPLIAKWEQKMGVQVEEWEVRKMRTKWGTCNIEKRKLSFNLELIKKPIHCIEYIIVHELVHLLERLHNEQFHAYMDKFFPNWKSVRKELNDLPVGHIHGLDY